MEDDIKPKSEQLPAGPANKPEAKPLKKGRVWRTVLLVVIGLVLLAAILYPKPYSRGGFSKKWTCLGYEYSTGAAGGAPRMVEVWPGSNQWVPQASEMAESFECIGIAIP